MSQPQQMNMGGPVGGMAAQQQMANAGTPSNGSGAAPIDAVKRLNTAIYDYLLRNSLHDAARALYKSVDLELEVKKSPNQRQGQANGAGGDDGMDVDNNEIKNKPDDLPTPVWLGDGVFLQDWWCQFWEIFQGHRGKGKPSTLSYIGAQRQAQKQRTAMMGGQNMDPAAMQNMRGYNNMMQMNNGMNMAAGDLKRTAMQNPKNMTPQQIAQMRNIQAVQNNQMMQGQQMERQGSQMDGSGPRSGSPNSGDAPSPKRQRLEGNMQQQMGPGGRPGPPAQMHSNQVGPSFPPNPTDIARVQEMVRQRGMDPEDPTQITPQQILHLATQPANNQRKAVDSYRDAVAQSTLAQMTQAKNTSNGMNKGQMPPNPAMQAGAQGSPMSQAGMEGANGEFYAAAAGGRMPMPGGPQAAAVAQQQAGGNGNHALQDYQMQLMLLEQQNKKRLLMARQEQDSMAHPANVGPNGQQFPPGMSPQNRGGDPSPGPGDIARGTPKMGKAGMSPNGDMSGRGSPQPGMMAPGGMVPPELRQQMMNGHMRPPPSSHPMANMNLTPEQMQMLQQRPPQPGMQLPNGQWQPGVQGPQGHMMPGQQPGGPGQPGPPQPNMTPRQSNMAPPPPPSQQGNNGTQPSSPAQPPAPPTPSQANKAKPGGKKSDAKKGAANKKGGATATPAAESEAPPTPTPATPITPMHQNSFNPGQNKQMPNGQQAQQHQPNQPPQQQGQQPGAVQPPQAQVPAPGMDQPFGSLDGNQFEGMNMDFADLSGPDVLDNFDFDSFLNTGAGDDMGVFDANFAFDGTSLEAGGDMGGQ